MVKVLADAMPIYQPITTDDFVSQWSDDSQADQSPIHNHNDQTLMNLCH